MSTQDFIDTEKRVNKAVLSAFLRAGYTNYTANEINVITDAVFKWLEISGKGLTIEDIEKGIELGSLGEFGSFVGINAVNVIGWLRTWKMSPKRFQSKRAADISKQLPSTGTITPEEQRKKDLEWIEKAKNTPNYVDFGDILYHALYRQGLMVNDMEEIEKAAKEVKEETINEGRKKVASLQMGSGQLLELIEKTNKSPLEAFRIEIRKKRVNWWLERNR